MAILYNEKIGTNHYKVCSAGATLKFYRNGVHHSQFNPNRPLYGCIWDLITLPALYMQEGSIKDVLMLGFGAGAVALKLKLLIEPSQVTGVELDPIHLKIAKEIFKSTDGCEFVIIDAAKWVQKEASASNPKTFDLIIDDIYTEEENIPERGVPFRFEWCKHLARLLNPGGTLVFNIVGWKTHLPHLKTFLSKSIYQKQFPYFKGFRLDSHGNRIVALSGTPFETTILSKKLKDIYHDYPRCRGVHKKYLSFDLTSDKFENLKLS